MLDAKFNININLPEISMKAIHNAFTGIKTFIHRKENGSFEKLLINSEKAILYALINAVSLILNDRLDSGPGIGGWAKSDKLYEEKLYGKTAASKIEDSVMGSVVAVIGLLKCRRILRRLNEDKAIGLACKIDEVLDDFESYIAARWNSDYGFGYTYTSRENEPNISPAQPSYRHTAWFLSLWLENKEYSDRIEKTLDHILRCFNDLDWKNEKVATDIATYVALKKLLAVPSGQIKSDISSITGFVEKLEYSIINKYAVDLSGWTSHYRKIDDKIVERNAGRQPYTLFVLAELYPLVKGNAELIELLDKALSETLTGQWKSAEGECGFSELAGEESSFDVSCLGVTALLRKPKRTTEEDQTLLEAIVYVLNALISKDKCIKDAYLWPLCYFVQELCYQIS